APNRSADERPQTIAPPKALETLPPPTPLKREDDAPKLAEVAEALLDQPPLIPSRPPLREEEGMIEVGWSGSLEAEIRLSETLEDPASREGFAQTAPLGEETVEDHYAALQAWTEWARNRGR